MTHLLDVNVLLALAVRHLTGRAPVSAYAKAEMPVMSRPTMSAWTVSVPS